MKSLSILVALFAFSACGSSLSNDIKMLQAQLEDVARFLCTSDSAVNPEVIATADALGIDDITPLITAICNVEDVVAGYKLAPSSGRAAASKWIASKWSQK